MYGLDVNPQARHAITSFRTYCYAPPPAPSLNVERDEKQASCARDEATVESVDATKVASELQVISKPLILSACPSMILQTCNRGVRWIWNFQHRNYSKVYL
ncbi:hypothetical protein WAI453_000381 [Rhynchosporium graminicola]